MKRQTILDPLNSFNNRFEVVFFKAGTGYIFASAHRIHSAHVFHQKHSLRYIYPRTVYFGGRLIGSARRGIITLEDNLAGPVQNAEVDRIVTALGPDGPAPNKLTELNLFLLIMLELVLQPQLAKVS